MGVRGVYKPRMVGTVRKPGEVKKEKPKETKKQQRERFEREDREA